MLRHVADLTVGHFQEAFLCVCSLCYYTHTHTHIYMHIYRGGGVQGLGVETGGKETTGET